MPELQTTNFGNISFEPGSVFEFPRGLPGFEDCRQFVPVQNQQSAPIVFLQSVDVPSLCFITLPVLVVDPQYRLQVLEQDLETLEFPAGRHPVIGEEILCLAVVSIRDGGPTANLLAPVVVNLTNHNTVHLMIFIQSAKFRWRVAFLWRGRN